MSKFPTGSEFLVAARTMENQNEVRSLDALPNMGQKAPQCFERIGHVLTFTDRMASCFWTCASGDHVIEYLTGRATSNARAALRLALFGFYDEALVMASGLGELANLFYLFTVDNSRLANWKTCTNRASQYSAVKVRL